MITDESIKRILATLPQYLDLHYKNTKKIINSKIFYKLRDEKTASAELHKNNITIYDYGTGQTFNVIQLYARDYNLDSKKDFIKICDEIAKKFNLIIDDTQNNKTKYPPLNIKIRERKKPQPKIEKKEDTPTKDIIDFSDKFEEWHTALLQNQKALDYIHKRGISDTLIHKYKIGYCKDSFYYFLVSGKPIKKYRFSDSLIFRLNNNNLITRTLKKESEFNPKSKKIFSPVAENKDKIFNFNYLLDSDNSTKIFICEGIFNSLSIEELNRDYKAIAINSIYSKNQFLESIKDIDFKGTFYLIPDIDQNKTGINGAEEICNKLKERNIRAYIYNYDSIHTDLAKYDINDILITQREELKASIKKFI